MIEPAELDVLCPDCSRPLFDRDGHDATCPHALAIEEICGKDRVFFEEHPHATHYWREVTYAEGLETLAVQTNSTEMPEGAFFTGKVKVTRISEGVRARDLEQVVMVLIP
jgi:hypothetical protein